MSTTTTNRGYTKQDTGENVGAWGPPLNGNFDIIDANLSGTHTVALSGSNVTLTAEEAEDLRIELTGTLLANVSVLLPAQRGFWIIDNQTTGDFTVTVKTTAGGSTGVTADQGNTSLVYSDGTNVKYGNSRPPSSVIAANVTVTPPTNYTASDLQTMINALATRAGQVGELKLAPGGNVALPGTLICDGSAVSRTTYANLFAYLVTSQGFSATGASIASASATFTVTIASPAVVTATAHGLSTGEPLRLTTTGALPTGLSTGTTYYVEAINANTFYLTDVNGTRINTSGTQSGTHTYWRRTVVTAAAHGFLGGERLRFATSGALPTGMNTSTDYFVSVIDTNTFRLLTSQTVTTAWVFVTSAGSGVHTYTRSLWGLGDGSTTFNLPDYRDRFIRGLMASTRAAGSLQLGQNESHSHTGTTNTAGAHTHNVWASEGNVDGSGDKRLNSLLNSASGADSTGTTSNNGNHEHDFTTAASGGSEARPINLPALVCIVF